MRLQRAVHLSVVGLVANLLLACGSGAGNVGPASPPPPSGSYTLTITQGNKQNVFAGAVAPVAVFVRVGSTGAAPTGVSIPLTVQLPSNVQAFPQITESGTGWLTSFWLRAPETPFTTERVRITAPGGVAKEVTISSGPRLKKTLGNAATADSIVLPDGRVIAFGEWGLHQRNLDSNVAAYRADGTVEKLFAPGDLIFPIGSPFVSAKFLNGEIVVGGHNSEFWFLDQSLNVKRFINECHSIGPGADPDHFPVSDSEGNLYFLHTDFDRTLYLKKMTPNCEFTKGGVLAIESFLGPRDLFQTSAGTFLAMTDPDDNYDTSTIYEFDFSGKIIRRKTLPAIPRWPGGHPAYRFGGQRPDGAYVLARDQSMGLLFLDANFDIVGELQLHSTDGSPARVGPLRGIDGAGNFYFGNTGFNEHQSSPLLKFNPEGELLWWSGFPLIPPVSDMPPVAPFPITDDSYFTTGAIDFNGDSILIMHRSRGQLVRLYADGASVSYPVGNAIGPVLGPDGHLYTAHWESRFPDPSVVVMRAWTASMQPVSSFAIPEIPHGVSAFAFSAGGELYLVDSGWADVHVVDASHAYVRKMSLGLTSAFPKIAVTADNDLIISYRDQQAKHYITKFTTSGTIVWSKTDPGSAGFTLDGSGRIWLHSVQGVEIWDAEGNFLGGGSVIQPEPSGNYPRNTDTELPIAAHGNDVWFYCGGRVYIASAE